MDQPRRRAVPAAVRHGRREVRRFVEEYQLPDKKVFVLAEGRLLNHVAAEANPAAVMDMSFANQVLSVEYLLQHGKALEPRYVKRLASLFQMVTSLPAASL